MSQSTQIRRFIHRVVRLESTESTAIANLSPVSFLDVLDALHNRPLEFLGLSVSQVPEMQEGGCVAESYFQFWVPL